jgi:hypothetical protein
MSTGTIDTSHKTLEFPYQQIFSNYGFSIEMNQKLNGLGFAFQPGDSTFLEIESGFLEANKVNQGADWLSGIADGDEITQNLSFYNWIASGGEVTDATYLWGSTTTIVTGINRDAGETWESLLGGTWAPYRFTRNSSSSLYETGPATGENNAKR